MKSTVLIVAPLAIVMLVLVAIGSGGPVGERDEEWKKIGEVVVGLRLAEQPKNLTNTAQESLVRRLRAAPGSNKAEEGNEEQWVYRIAQNGNHGDVLIKRNVPNPRLDDTEDGIEEASEIGAIVNN